MKKIIFALLLFIIAAWLAIPPTVFAQNVATPENVKPKSPKPESLKPKSLKPKSLKPVRVLLIPLDDRPPCVEFEQMLGRIANAEVVAPPRSMLGRFTEAGKPQAIADWLKNQDLSAFEAAIVSFDMAAYGGLVASRVFDASLAQSQSRLRMIEDLHARAPRMPIYGFSIIMRLAPTGDGKNEAYRARLARWAEISPYIAEDENLKQEVVKLEREIPAAALADYKQARARNLAINNQAIEMTARGTLRYLILGQDDAKPRGIHVADRESLTAKIKNSNLLNKVAVQPGADEVAMLLLARALNDTYDFTPRVLPVFSSEATRNHVAPFEDRKLFETVSYHINAIGGREVVNSNEADIQFFVYASRFEAGAANRFARQVADAVTANKKVVVADIDMKGDVQGADPAFTEALRRRKIFPRLAGYASWNTAGNTIGTALPHGAIYTLAVNELTTRNNNSDSLRLKTETAQVKFLIHRLLDDYAYHAVVRPQAKAFAVERKLNPNNLDAANTKLVEAFTHEKLAPYLRDFRRDFNLPEDNNFTLALPWGRTFEAAIDFHVAAQNADTKNNMNTENKAQQR